MIRAVEKLDESLLPAETAVEEDAGFGALQTPRGCLPLVALDVQACITGLVAETVVRQTFQNSLEEPLEATYIFPLPDRAAVTRFRLKVAGRVVEGQLKERAQAREEYRQAIEAGHRAAIAEEERSGTFSLRVGNIPPREQVSVELVLVGPLPVCEGQAAFRFPLVVAPRYVPGVPLDGPPVGSGVSPDTDQVPDASRVTPPVLLPGFPNPVRLSLEVQLDPAGLAASPDDWARQVRSSLHSVITEDGPPWTVRLQPGERLNRDFLLRFPVAAAELGTSVLFSPAAEGKPGTFALTIAPPALEGAALPRPRDVVFVLDRSGSMSGWKMVAARRAVGRLIDTLLDHDRFVVLAFDDRIEYAPHANPRLVEATNRCRWQMLEWLGMLDARGGTEMGPALEEAIRTLAGSEGGSAGAPRDRIVVLVTDGQVAGEDVILRTVATAAGPEVPRIHTLGIDRAVNAGFLGRLAELGRGSFDLVESEEQLDEAMDRIHRTVATPVLTGLRIEPVGFACGPESVVPSRLPDVFPDRPVMIFGRCDTPGAIVRLRVSGQDARGRPWQCEAAGRPGSPEVLRSLWGRAKVRELEDRYAAGRVSDPQSLASQIVAVSLETNVLSRFTAYVAVDTSETVNPGGQQREITQPVELPDGWDASPVDISWRASDAVLHRMVCLSAPSSPPPVARDASFLSSLMGSFFEASDILTSRKVPPRQSPAPPPSATQAEIVNRVRNLLDQVARRTRLRTRRDRLQQLIEALQSLRDLLRSQQHAAWSSWDQLTRSAEQLRDAYDAGDQESLRGARLTELLEAIRRALETLTGPSGGASPRERFWT